jgi:hypothetical protein
MAAGDVESFFCFQLRSLKISNAFPNDCHVAVVSQIDYLKGDDYVPPSVKIEFVILNPVYRSDILSAVCD